MKRKLCLMIVLLAAVAPGPAKAATSDGAWISKVPERARERLNPFNADADASQAGAKLYQRNCASCHGSDAEGRGTHPALRSGRVHDATDGELEWLLRNGSMRRGMPSWSRLPEAERWQLVRYLRTLPLN